MKQLYLVLILVLASFGCQNVSEQTQNGDNLILLPPDVAGTWKTEGRSPWTITLAPDGKISWAITSMGQVRIRPNQTTKIEMINDKISTVSAGECPVSYDPVKRELSVTILIEHLDVKIGDDGFEGNSEDIFFGPVSKDGKTWQTTWISVFDYGPRFPQAEEDIVGVPLKFEKVADYQKDK